MKNIKLTLRAIISLVLSIILFCMPIAAYAMNGSNTINVYAESDAGMESTAQEPVQEEQDITKPTLNAAVSGGLLSIHVYDVDSGANAVYVNGYEFTNLADGELNIRLQQFDAGYEFFTIYATDNAGNRSSIYRISNPYYKSPTDESGENPVELLPLSAEATRPGRAVGIVTAHTQTDSEGNTVSETESGDGNFQPAEEETVPEAIESVSGNVEQTGQGKEFYTIQTATDKVFYLIIDRDGDEEIVYFLTEITENDLLNVTSDNSETLPKNSATVEAAIPTTESALPNNNVEQQKMPVEETEDTESAETDTESVQEPGEAEVMEATEEVDPTISYILMGGLAVAVIGGGYYFKVVRKKKENFIEDEDEDEEDVEEYEVEDEESEDNPEDDFFMNNADDDESLSDDE